MNSTSIYPMNEDVNEKLDKIVRGYQKGNKLAKEMSSEEEENMRFQIWDSAVFDAVCAAKDMYLEGEKNLDKCLDLLVDWLEKCKGKEEELKKTVKQEMKSEDDD